MKTFTETTGSHPILLEWKSSIDGRMVGELKDDNGLYDQMMMGRHLDAPDCIPVGSHRVLDNDCIVGQSAVR